MQVFKKINKVTVILFSLNLFFSTGLFSESIEVPKMPSGPEMPVITSPSMDGVFYKPSIPKPAGNVKNEEKQNQVTSSTNSVLSDATTTDDIISSFLSGNTNLTANDISTLYDSGLFTNVSSLANLNAKSLVQNTNSESTNMLLKQVLESLEELKNGQKNFSPVEMQELSNHQKDSATFKTREPSILRFKVNGYSLNESFTKVFFSETESDGTFLLTADRKYFANQKPHEETVYILFRAIKSRGYSVLYSVQPTVVQTIKNENSYMYKLSQLKNLTAEKTGNLVVLHNDGDVTVDLLLDIDR